MLLDKCFVCGEKIVDMHCTIITKKNVGVISLKCIDMHDKCFDSASGQEFADKLSSIHKDKKDLCEHKLFVHEKSDLVCKDCGLILYDFYISYLKKHGVELEDKIK